MPNWTHNTLMVTGDKAAVAAYVEHVHVKDDEGNERPLDFNACAPMPEDVDNWHPDQNTPLSQLFGGGWYGWAIRHWGTKWNASFNSPFGALGIEEANVELSVEAKGVQLADGVAIYKFDTAWSPPVAWLEASAAEHPELSFKLRWAEVGNGLAGEVSCHDGGNIEETELTVEDVLAPEEMWF
jgi:hypothetical protein